MTTETDFLERIRREDAALTEGYADRLSIPRWAGDW